MAYWNEFAFLAGEVLAVALVLAGLAWFVMRTRGLTRVLLLVVMLGLVLLVGWTLGDLLWAWWLQ